MSANKKPTTGLSRAEIRAEIANLEKIEVHVETNQGTYGPTEAARKVGTGDPACANREVYETVGGTRREKGPSEEDAPGRMREINRTALAEYRTRLAELRKALRAAK